MKKIFTLIYAVLFAASMSAETFTFTSQKDTLQTKNGITVRLRKGTGSSNPAFVSNNLRLYAKNTITISGDSISAVSLTFSKQGSKPYADLSASKGTLTSGGTSTSSSNKVTDKWTGKSTKEVIFTMGASGQRIIYELSVTQGGGGGGSDTTYITDLPYADAYYYTYDFGEEGVEQFYDFDIYKDYDFDTYEFTYPEFYLMTSTQSKTQIAGNAYVYYAGLWTSAKDSVDMSDGTLTVSVNADKSYNFYGEFVDNDDNVYILDCKNVDVAAYDYDNDYKEITLTDVPTSISSLVNNESTKKTTKVLDKGNVVIIRNGEKFNITGQRIQ